MTSPESQKIKFKPVHTGVGFHPFSDGLPYAPLQNGTGATAAGRPTFAHTPPQLHGRAQPLHAQPNPQRVPLNPQRPQNLNINPYLQRMEPPVKAEVKPSMTTEDATLRRRVFAYLLDSVIHAGFWLVTNLAALFVFHFQLDTVLFKDNLLQFLAFYALSQWFFIALQEMLFETSIGKAFFSLEFKRNHSSLLLRSIVFMVGAAFFGLGFIFRPQDKLGQLTLKTRPEHD